MGVHFNLWNCTSTEHTGRKRTIWLGSDVWDAVPNPRYLAGISAKCFLDETNAIDGALLRRLSSKDDYYIWADYLYHIRSLIMVEQGEVPVYLGIGGRLKLQESNEDKFGIRFPVGLAYEFAGMPVDAFFEVVPIWDVAVSSDFDLEGGIGVRFYSKPCLLAT